MCIRDRTYPSDLLWDGVNGIGADDPRRKTGSSVHGNGNFHVANRLISREDGLDDALKSSRNRVGKHLGHGSAKVVAERQAGRLRKNVVHTNETKLFIEKRQADGSVGEH